MGLNDLLVKINYIVARIKEDAIVLGHVNEYIQKVDENLNNNANIDLFPMEDMLNREFSIDLFVVPMENKAQFLLNQPKVVAKATELSESVNNLRFA